ncbi:DMT family transporter [Leptolyngbya sp. FACHB-261]|uniref:DMT family transporter n=1 Tax=Leptolyngbya sp. FACHB-261 TaxID=2692806 RepID=UPI0016852FAE|nr:DMT family transporter [Leptolyngbya sp. FACHB-261]MBD2104546.1 DMT family transporter [Leptolyngbya sp. FACHB-261]
MVRLSQKALRTQGVALLVAITVVWGTTFPLLKGAVESLSPAVLIGSRFVIAALALAPFVRLNITLLRDGLLLGLLLFAAFATQVLGLETTSANRAAFITALNVILVPLLEPLLGRRLPHVALVAAGLALTGIGIMSWEGGSWVVGDFWMLGCALSYALYILLLEAVTPQHAPLSLSAVQLAVVALLGLGWSAPALLEQWPAVRANFTAVLYLGLIATAIATWVQAVAQRWLSASETALIYALEPVFAAVFSFWLLGESLGVRGLLGAGLVLGATVLSQVRRES